MLSVARTSSLLMARTTESLLIRNGAFRAMNVLSKESGEIYKQEVGWHCFDSSTLIQCIAMHNEGHGVQLLDGMGMVEKWQQSYGSTVLYYFGLRQERKRLDRCFVLVSKD
jgi:hypothetical protein